MSNVLASALARYEKIQEKSTLPKINQDDRMKMYFGAVLPKGVHSQTKRIRILPPIEGRDVFWEELFFHDIKVGKDTVKLYDPAQDGEESPLNEVKESLYASGDEEDRKLALTYTSRRFYVFRIIDRDNEADGVKFWRVKDNYKKEGVFDKIIDVLKVKGEDISDPQNGRDIILSLSLQKSPQGREYTAITSIIPDDKSPLSTDPEKMRQWLSYELTAKQAYPKKSIEYLRGVAEGYEPVWDKVAKKWVYGESVNLSEEGEISGGNSNGDTSSVKYQIVDTQENDLPDDDLPF